MPESHTIVVGGGIVGISASYFLARRGERVTLLEKGDCAHSASTGNAGLISLGHPPLPRPGLTARAIRWMIDSGSPLYIPPRLDWRLPLWLWRFHQACGAEQFRRSMEILAEHGRAAGACFRQLVEDEGIEFEYRSTGQLEVFRTEAGVRTGAAEAALMREHGFDVGVVSGEEIRRREPALRPEVRGALILRDNAFADPGVFVRELLDRARRRGVVLREQAAVDRLLVDGGRCAGVRLADGERIESNHTVLAAGIWSTALARQHGVRIPMQPAKGYHVELSLPTPPLTTAAVLAEAFVAATPLAGGLRLAGTLEFSGINHRMVMKRLDMLRRGARRYLHGIDDARTRATWCGLRPCTADGLPVIGWAPRAPDLFIATGHAMMGFTLGPLTGRLVSEALLDGKPSLDLAGLGPERFR